MNGPVVENVKTRLTPREEEIVCQVRAQIGEAEKGELRDKPILIDACSSIQWGTWHIDKSPCLTSARTVRGGFWVLQRESMLMGIEMARLMGIPDVVYDRMKQTGTSRETILKAIGNGQSINVLERVLGHPDCGCLNKSTKIQTVCNF